jgi:hypothetical protein
LLPAAESTLHQWIVVFSTIGQETMPSYNGRGMAAIYWPVSVLKEVEYENFP